MKEALQLVKQELGPEAIILSAKDNKRSFGLVGKGSVEITAAISEKSLLKKKYVEKNLPDDAREKFRGQSAKKQKEYIDGTVAKLQNRVSANEMANARLAMLSGGTGAMSKRPMTSQRYIDIDNDEAESENSQSANTRQASRSQAQPQPTEAPLRGRRVDDVLREFSKVGSFIENEDEAPRAQPRSSPQSPQRNPQRTPQDLQAEPAHDEVFSLRKEVESLREILSQFGKDKAVTRHPGADYGLPFELSGNFEKLSAAGLDTQYVVDILNLANEELTPVEKKKTSLVDGWVARYILSHTSVTGHWLKPGVGCQVHVFVGPSGHGKTSALVKVASQLVLHEKKKVAVLSADTHKVGAADQLRIYCQILNLPFETVKHNIEFPKIMQRYQQCDVVLVDYPGFSLKDIQEIDQIRTLLPTRDIPKQTHLVLSCASKDRDAYEVCHRYQVTHFDDILVTKIDESFVHGFLYNIQKKTEKSLYAFGLGPKIPEDIELATRQRVIDLIYKITKNNK